MGARTRENSCFDDELYQAHDDGVRCCKLVASANELQTRHSGISDQSNTQSSRRTSHAIETVIRTSHVALPASHIYEDLSNGNMRERRALR